MKFILRFDPLWLKELVAMDKERMGRAEPETYDMCAAHALKRAIEELDPAGKKIYFDRALEILKSDFGIESTSP